MSLQYSYCIMVYYSNLLQVYYSNVENLHIEAPCHDLPDPTHLGLFLHSYHAHLLIRSLLSKLWCAL